MIVRGTCKKLERLETVLLDSEPVETRRQIDCWRVPAAQPPLRIIRPGIIRPEFESRGRVALKVLATAPLPSMRFRWSDAAITEARDAILRRLAAAGIEGIPDLIEEQVFLTPADMGRRFRHSGGALYDPRTSAGPGWLLRPANQVRGVTGLYLAGGGAHPGPGIAGHLRSGMLAAECAGRDWRFRV
jgi:phytoene dehydrogenase-like protein